MTRRESKKKSVYWSPNKTQRLHFSGQKQERAAIPTKNKCRARSTTLPRASQRIPRQPPPSAGAAGRPRLPPPTGLCQDPSQRLQQDTLSQPPALLCCLHHRSSSKQAHRPANHAGPREGFPWGSTQLGNRCQAVGCDVQVKHTWGSSPDYRGWTKTEHTWERQLCTGPAVLL